MSTRASTATATTASSLPTPGSATPSPPSAAETARTRTLRQVFPLHCPECGGHMRILATLVVQEGGYRTRTLGANARNFFDGLREGAREGRGASM